MDALASESSYYAQERFIYGYRLGVLMNDYGGIFRSGYFCVEGHGQDLKGFCLF